MRSVAERHLQSQIEARLVSEWGRLVRLCASVSGNADAAEDLAQETFIEAWRHAGDLRDPHAFQPWLSGIARNVCRRWLRHQGREAGKIDRLARFEGMRILGTEKPGSTSCRWNATSL